MGQLVRDDRSRPRTNRVDHDGRGHPARAPRFDQRLSTVLPVSFVSENAGPVAHDRAPSLGEHVARGGGLVVVACLVAAAQVAPDPPAHGAPDAAVLAFYQQHRSGLLTGTLLWALAMIALVVFAAALARAGESTSASVTFAAARAPGQRTGGAGLAADVVRPLAAVAATMFLVAQGALGAAAVLASGGAPATSVRALDEVSHLTSHLATLPLGGVVLAAPVTVYRPRSLATRSRRMLRRLVKLNARLGGDFGDLAPRGFGQDDQHRRHHWGRSRLLPARSGTTVSGRRPSRIGYAARARAGLPLLAQPFGWHAIASRISRSPTSRVRAVTTDLATSGA